MKEFLKKIDFKSGFLYFAFIFAETIVTATFLSMLIVTPIRFIFKEPGIARDVAELIGMILLEMIIRFFVFFALFKNNRNLIFKQFCINYSVTYVLRLVFSLLTTFAAFSAGMSVLLSGTLLSSTFIEKDIITMHDVPTALYILLFTLFEAVTLLIVYLGSKLAEHKREKTRKELLNEHKNN